MLRMRAWITALMVLAMAGPACAAPPSVMPSPFPATAAPASPTVEPSAEPLPLSTALPASPMAQPSPLPATPETPASGVTHFDIGNPTLTEFYVSPTGSNANSGLSADAPLQTLTEAWARLPMTTTTTGYRINLLPGTYPCEPGEPDNCQNFFSDRYGSYAFPIWIRAANGPGTATLRGGLNIKNAHYLYLTDLTLVGGMPLPVNSAGNDLLHLEATQHVLVRGLAVRGPNCDNDQCNNLQEVFKVNQAQYLYVEDSEFGGAWHTAVDFFVVQYGHFIGNNLHTAGQWCMYVKGGTAYYTIDGNELHHCLLGLQTGQAANLAVMISPWWHHEAYALKVTNNVLHDLPGTGLSVAGGYDILFAYNTLYRVAYDTNNGYGAFQMVHGERNCTGIDEIPNVTANCPVFTGLGAWGPAGEDTGQPGIPNQNVFVYNNVLYNPAPLQTLYATFNIVGPIARPAGFANSPDPAHTDDNLVFTGNVIWDGAPDHPLGVGDAACLPGHPTCNETLIRADNTINTLEPVFVGPACGDYRLTTGTAAFATTAAIPDFPTWATFMPPVPAGVLTNTVGLDYAGVARTTLNPPGAFFTTNSATACQSLYLPTVRR